MKKLLKCLIFIPFLSAHALIGGKTYKESSLTKEVSQYVVKMWGCTFTRISTRSFLGASHCAAYPGDKFKIEYGVDVTENKLLINDFMTDSYIPFDYEWYEEKIRAGVHDLMIVTIDELSAKKLSDVKIARVNFKRPNIGQKVIVAGYGCYDKKVELDEVQLRRKLKIKSDQFFRTIEKEINEIEEYDISVEGREGSQLCFGDSGGGLFNENHEVIGVNIQSNHKKSLFSEKMSRIDELSPTSREDQLTPHEWIKKYLD